MSTYQITNNADLTKLDTHFKDNLYVGGHSPNADDLTLFQQFTTANTEPDQDNYPNLWSWFALCSIYLPQVRETWKAAQGKAAAAKPAAAAANKPAAKSTVKEAAKPKPAADDDMDLFGDDDGDDAAALEAMKKKKEEDKNKKSDKPALIAKSLILLDVKVWDPEQDYDALAKRIIQIEKDGLFWKSEYQLVDVAFGVKKIVIGMVVEDAKVSVEDIIDELQSWEDDVQSVDIACFNKI
jgi:elongation factor 1-beta